MLKKPLLRRKYNLVHSKYDTKIRKNYCENVLLIISQRSTSKYRICVL